MKRLLIVCVAVLSLALCSSVFAKECTQKTPEQRVEHLTKVLDLTPEQQVKVKDIIIRRDAELGSLFKSLSDAKDKEEQREIKMDILEQHQRFRKELDGVLTDVQVLKFQELIDKSRQEWKERNKG